MWRSSFIYVPPALMLIAATRLPEFGRRVIGEWDARQLLLAIAFVWMAIAIVWRVIRSMSTGAPSDIKNQAGAPQVTSIVESVSREPVPLEHRSPDSETATTSDGRSVVAVLCILVGVVICAMGLAVLTASSGLVDPDFGRSIVVMLVGSGLCGTGMFLRRPKK